ncbi:phosphate metabolism protein 7 [Coemansia biformis]|uniref:Phosphate metabolism protein 7 n=1 Tax=Coemansia biformis TaxID=1286918 RepID=A0A9W7YFB1_9FUNG|nr:phosphate metabolism protein 7 [Coemansia biformis]
MATFVSSLVFNIAAALVLFVAFSVLRPRLRRVYAPRTYAVEREKRPLPVGRGIFAWVPAALRAPDADVIRQSGLDAYMFLRSIRTMFIMFGVLGVISTASILPVNIMGTAGQQGLNALSIGNVDSKSNLLWVHIGVFALTIVWSIWCMVGELRIYTHLRMWWLTEPQNTAQAGASTVLVANIPEGLVDDDQRLHALFDSTFPGGVRRIYVNRSSKELKRMVKKRDGLARRLEQALTAYAIQCTRASERAAKAGSPYEPPARPNLRAGGRRVEAFVHYASEIAICNNFIAQNTKTMATTARLPSALVMFNKPIAAHMAAQCVLDYRPFALGPVSTNVCASDIIWSNLHIRPWSRRIRGYVSFAATLALTVAWTIFSASLSGLVQAGSLAELSAFSWLKSNRIAMSIFSGIVPSLVLAVLMAILPAVLKLLLRLEGTVRRSEIDLRMLHRYYFFQVWNVYLVTIFSSSMVQIVAQSIGRPENIVKLIQSQVPQSATNILTYVLLLAFVGAAKEVLQAVPLALRYVGPAMLAKTPRALRVAEQPREFDWAAAIPTHSLVFLMGFSYSFIAPIVNWFVATYFGLFYLVYRYQFLYVYNTSKWTVGGLSFPKAIKQMLVGVYISEVYMLLLMVANVRASASPIARVAVAALLIVLTAGAHLYINDVCMPSIRHLPVKRAADIERSPLLANEFPNVLGEHDNVGVDVETQRAACDSEARLRSRIYAMYSSLIPVCAINLGLRLLPCLLRPASAREGGEECSGGDDEELTVGGRGPACGEFTCSDKALERQPHAACSDAEFVREFAAPEVRAKPMCNLWVPLGNARLFSRLVWDVEYHGQGTIFVITEGADITPGLSVGADPDFDIERAEVGDKAELAAAQGRRADRI